MKHMELLHYSPLNTRHLFSISNGNTQVSAEELRNMPLPPIEIIREFGRQLIAKRVQSDEIDDWLQSQETMGGTGTYG